MFAKRIHTPEIMDVEKLPPELLSDCYDFLAWVNRWLGGRRALVSRFEEFSRRWKPGERITVLDVGTGAADLPAALCEWGRGRGFDIRIVGLDIDRAALRLARAREPGLLYCASDVNRLGFRDGAFDYVISTHFFHHLTDEQVVSALKTFDRIARRGIVVNDLLRHVRAWVWIKLITLFANRVVRNDGPLSVRRGFRIPEAKRLASEAGLSYLSPRVHFGHRFTLAGEKV